MVCGSTNDMTSANTTTCGNASYKGGNEAVYTFTAATTGTYNVAYNGVTYVGIFVYAGCPTSGGTCVGNVTTSTSSKNLNVALTAATQYYIVFDTWPTPNSPCAGTFSLTPPPSPCTGTPSPGNTTGPIAVGSGETVNLGLQNPTAGTGVTYQWHFSIVSSTGPWTNGGTAATYAPTQTVPTWYYADVICSTGPSTGSSSVLLVGISYCTPAPTSVDGTGITRVVYSTVNNATGVEAGNYGNYSAFIGNVTQGTTVPVDITFTTGYTYDTKIWIDWNDDLDFDDAGENVYTGMSTNANPTTLNASFAVGMNPLGNHRMRIGSADSNPVVPCFTASYGSYEDYTINVVANAACSGTPTPGATTGPSAICVGDPVNLGLTNATLGSGVTYAWFASTTSAVAGFGPVGTGLATYSPVGQSVTTWYYADVTCSAGPSTGTSSVLQVSINAPSACYCTPGNFTYDIEPITLVNFAGINQSSCAAVDCDGDVVDYTAGTPGAVIAGQSYTITVKGNTNGSYTSYFTAFFDWDQNGTFETTQAIGSVNGSTGLDALQASISIAVPINAVAGGTRMRVIKNYNTSPTDPCATYGFGQVEDYTINVTVPSCTAPAVTINVTPNCPAGFGVAVAVADFGDGASATINWSLNGVAQTPIAAVIGSNVLPGGPFANGADVDVTVLHENDSDCNVAYNNNTYTCPPVNDECAGAITLTVNADYACGSVTAGTVINSTASADANTCGGTDDDDVWYKFTATSVAHRVSLINITGSTSDMYMAISSGSCGSQTSVLCSDSETANLTGLTIGTVYTVRVYTWTSTPGQTSNFNICVGTPPPPPPAPANDECAAAVNLTVNADYACGSVTAGTIAGATASAGAVSPCFGSADDDVWYTFTATSTAHRVSLTNITGSVTDMYMAISSGSCGSLTSVLCSDPNDANLTGLTIGVVYTVRVYTYTSTPGQTTTFNICVGTAPPPPANDNCAGAYSLTVNSDFACASVTAGTLASATASPENAAACAGTENDDVWFTFVATSTTHRVSLINIANGTTDLNHSLWTGGCGSLTLVPGTCSDPETSNPSGLSIGTTYFVRVNSYGSSAVTSTFNVCIGTPPPPPANDLCANAIAVGCNTITNGTTVASTTTGAPATCNSVGLNTAGGIWYTLAGFDGPMTIDLSGSNFDTKMGVFTGTCGALVCVTGDDDGGTGTTSLVTFAGSSAQTYYIYVTGYLTNTGTVVMKTICGTNNNACTENGLAIEFQTNNAPFENTWDLLDATGQFVVVSGGPLAAPGALLQEFACVPNGCYQFRVNDSGGNGMGTGGYVVRTQGTNIRIIDNANNFTTGSVSQSGEAFCLPLGTVELLYSSCDKYFWANGEYIVCNEDAAVAADYNGGGAAGADSGYDFWFFDPNGTYSYVRSRRHNVSDNFANVGSSRACHMKINNWTGNQIPNGLKLNVRVRPVVNGVAGAYGPACRFTRDEAVASCPPTLLFDVPGSPQFYSCGVSRNFVNNTQNRLYARPVEGATQYRFTFTNAELVTPIVRTSNAYYINLGWTAAVAPPLVAGQSYDVTVEAFKGGTWCIPGKVCIVTINNVVAGGQQNVALDGGSALNMWPNPNNGEVLNMSLQIADPFISTVSMDIFDLSGKRMVARTVAIQDGTLNTTIDLNGDLAVGMYMVKVTAGEEVFTQRVVIQK